ncbi:MAG: hypothetical protein H6607_02295 [Flavobacteriales bacterium]|nr:hypothetical protein [Flavobacteriales bacterium]
MKQLEEEIMEWAEKYSFDQLSPDMQKSVLSSISSEEYNQVHETFNSYSALFGADENKLQPSAHILPDLMQKQNAKKNGLAKILVYKMPVYQAVAACFLLLGLAYFSLKPKVESAAEIAVQKPVVERIYDTVYIEKPSIEKEPRVIEKKVFVQGKCNEPHLNKVNASREKFLAHDSVTPISVGDIVRSYGNTTVSAEKLEKFKMPM